MRPLVWFGVTLVVAIAITGCFIDRRGGLIADAGPVVRVDTGPIPPDTGPMPADVGPPPPDTGPPPPPCMEKCMLGAYCMDGVCMCPGASYCCAGCGPGFYCHESNTCRCTPGDCRCEGCPIGEMCQGDGRCAMTPPPSCGAEGEPCCTGSGSQCDTEWLYCDGPSCRRCGARFEPCCPGDRCMGSLRCGGWSGTCYEPL